MTLSIVIVSYNTRQLLLDCLESIYAHQGKLDMEIIVVDNNSKDGSATAVRQRFLSVDVIELEDNLGFAGGNNVGIRKAKGRYVLLLNSDTLLKEYAIQRLVEFLEDHPETMAVSPRLLNFDGSFQRSFFNFPTLPKAALHLLGLTNAVKSVLGKIISSPDTKEGSMTPVRVDYVIFAANMFRREIFNKVGLLDDRMFFYHEDCEFSLRMKAANIDQWYLPQSEILHLGGGSSHLASARSFNSFFQGMHYVFLKHFNIVTYGIFAVLWVVIFGLRSVLVFAGLFSSVGTPSTYSNNHSVSAPALNKRQLSKIYQNLMLLPFRTHQSSLKNSGYTRDV